MARNKAKFEERLPHPSKVAANYLAFLKKITHWKTFLDLFMTNSLASKPILEHPLVYWLKPPAGWLKANREGSFYRSTAGIGGVFRNLNGACLLHFLSPVVTADALEAKALTIFWAIYIATKAKFHNLIMKTDSK
ncbi:uncharacterized protein LOC110036114, partial [Phalaenopsis equestris]|uniref:uncharacterized protein LOC110036114 n=1 Tax=Phalaenopsis equestris TaxID=78828 RepID=UPI0009E45A2F